ncbi:phenylacetic acid degradation protein PaaD, partial [Providencia rettgeri]|nr:phenylacetic acid degradation protein PaaD [Providencia rettgeri]
MQSNAMAVEDPQALAQQVSDHMFGNDQASQALGLSLDSVAPGRADMSMTVRADMLNGHKTCHDGFSFAVADSTLAFACNSRNAPT